MLEATRSVAETDDDARTTVSDWRSREHTKPHIKIKLGDQLKHFFLEREAWLRIWSQNRRPKATPNNMNKVYYNKGKSTLEFTEQQNAF